MIERLRGGHFVQMRNMFYGVILGIRKLDEFFGELIHELIEPVIFISINPNRRTSNPPASGTGPPNETILVKSL